MAMSASERNARHRSVHPEKFTAEARSGKRKEYEAKYRQTEKYKNCQRRFKHSPKGRYAHLKHSAKTEGYTVTLSLDDYIDMVCLGLCHYCGGPLEYGGHSVDRKDSNLGYTLDNSVACCSVCNVTKSNKLSYEEMLLLCILRKRKGSVSWLIKNL